MEIFNCEQRTDEWYSARMGIPTASEYATIMMSGRGGGESRTRRTYLYKLAGEIITGDPMYSYKNEDMERGVTMEDEARRTYEFESGLELTRVGFIRNGRTGCSPDALIGEDGVLEIKTAFPHILQDLYARNEFPTEHRAQCQGALWITGRKWVDLVVYWPKMKLFHKRAFRDEAYIKQIAMHVDQFNIELSQWLAFYNSINAEIAA